MCIRYIEICPCCYHATGREHLQRCGPSCANVREEDRPVPRDRLANFVCRTEVCNLNQATRDRARATFREMGLPTLVIGPPGTGQREWDRLEREYGRYPDGTVLNPSTPAAVPRPAPRKRGPPSSVSASSSGNLGYIKFKQPSRGGAVKEQFRAKGDLDVNDLAPEVQESIQRGLLELNRHIEMQMAASGLQVESRTGVAANWPWIPAEDNFLQDLRCHGFSYSQIARDYITRRTREALIVRRNIQRETGHQRWEGRGFIYRPEALKKEHTPAPALAQNSMDGPAVNGEQQPGDI